MRRPLPLGDEIQLLRRGSCLLGLARHGGVDATYGKSGDACVEPWLVGVARLVELLDGTIVAGGGAWGVGCPEADLSALDAGNRAEGGADGRSGADHCD